MATPQLKAFDCFDHDPIDQWMPDSDEDVCYSLCLHIGPTDEEGSDLFYVDVYTQQAIKSHNLGKSVSQRGIVVNPYSWDGVMRKVQATIERCEGENWSQQAELLAKHFSWEFANYRPYTP